MQIAALRPLCISTMAARSERGNQSPGISPGAAANRLFGEDVMKSTNWSVAAAAIVAVAVVTGLPALGLGQGKGGGAPGGGGAKAGGGGAKAGGQRGGGKAGTG